MQCSVQHGVEQDTRIDAHVFRELTRAGSLAAVELPVSCDEVNAVSVETAAGVGQDSQAGSSGATVSSLATARFLSRAECYRLLQNSLSVSADQAPGLHLGEVFPYHTLGLVPMLVTQGETLEHAFGLLFRYSKLVSEQLGIDVAEQGDAVTVSCRSLPGASPWVQRFIAEVTMVGIYKLVRTFEPDAQPIRTAFAYGAPIYREEYERVFSGGVAFDQSRTGMTFSRAVLEVRSGHRDEGLFTTLQNLAERRLMGLSRRASYSARVREFLAEQPAPHRVAMEVVAEALQTSVRSLHRRLSDEGTSYSVVGNEVAALVAKRLVGDEQRSVKEAAFLMGFKDPNSFHRAFRRWTGTTPRCYQETGWQ